MGDRCCLSATVYREHLKKFQEITDMHEIGDQNKNWVELIDDQANWALNSELTEAAKKKLLFFGSHTPGDQYGAARFVGGRGKLLYIRHYEGLDVVPLGDHGLLKWGYLQEAQEFYKLEDAVTRFVTFFPDVPPKLINGFFSQYDKQGPNSATQWLKDKTKGKEKK